MTPPAGLNGTTNGGLSRYYCAGGGGVVPSAGGGVVLSGGGGVSDGVGLGAGSAGIGAGVVGAVSAGGVLFMSEVSSFFAQPAANTTAVTASKAKARMSHPSNVSDAIGSPTKRFAFSMVPNRGQSDAGGDECQCFVNARERV